MCLFFNKKEKDKEQIALLEQKVFNLENQISELIDMISHIYENNEIIIADLNHIKEVVNHHIQNDMDMTEGDEIHWEKN